MFDYLKKKWGRLISLYKKNIDLDANEKKFIKKKQYFIEPNASDDIGLIQCIKDYQYLSRVLEILNNKGVNPDNAKIFAIWPYLGMAGTIPKLNPFSLLKSKLTDVFLYGKWARIYSIIESISIIKIGQSNVLKNPKIFIAAFKVFKKLSKTKNLHDLVINGTPVGDLIYASFIRFRERGTIDYSDIFLYILILKTFSIQLEVKRLLSKYNIKFYVSSYTSYINHGVVVRELLKNGVTVYSLGNGRDILKRHFELDYSQKFRYWDYLSLLEKCDDLGGLMTRAELDLSNRFNGINDKALAYMKVNPYLTRGSTQLEVTADGVLFLHDFFDSPFDHRRYLFDDLFQWADHTLSLISRHKLNIAIKPHPNQIRDSSTVVHELKLKYPDVCWLDYSISNAILMNKIKCGISVFGSIIQELAYHNKIAIAAGEHPAYKFDLCYEPKSIAEYDSLLLNIGNLSAKPHSRQRAVEYYVANNYLISSDDIQLEMQPADINWENSSCLIEGISSSNKA